MQKLQKEIPLSFLSHPYLSGGTTINYSYLECASTLVHSHRNILHTYIPIQKGRFGNLCLRKWGCIIRSFLWLSCLPSHECSPACSYRINECRVFHGAHRGLPPLKNIQAGSVSPPPKKCLSQTSLKFIFFKERCFYLHKLIHKAGLLGKTSMWLIFNSYLNAPSIICCICLHTSNIWLYFFPNILSA